MEQFIFLGIRFDRQRMLSSYQTFEQKCRYIEREQRWPSELSSSVRQLHGARNDLYHEGSGKTATRIREAHRNAVKVYDLVFGRSCTEDLAEIESALPTEAALDLLLRIRDILQILNILVDRTDPIPSWTAKPEEVLEEWNILSSINNNVLQADTELLAEILDARDEVYSKGLGSPPRIKSLKGSCDALKSKLELQLKRVSIRRRWSALSPDVENTFQTLEFSLQTSTELNSVWIEPVVTGRTNHGNDVCFELCEPGQGDMWSTQWANEIGPPLEIPERSFDVEAPMVYNVSVLLDELRLDETARVELTGRLINAAREADRWEVYYLAFAMACDLLDSKSPGMEKTIGGLSYTVTAKLVLTMMREHPETTVSDYELLLQFCGGDESGDSLSSSEMQRVSSSLKELANRFAPIIETEIAIDRLESSLKEPGAEKAQ